MSKRKILCIKKCSNCDKEIEIMHKSRMFLENVFCSQKCCNEFKRKQREKDKNYLNCECKTCGKKFHLKPYSKNKSTNHYCSIECHKISKMEYMKGNKNHRYGLRGDKNPLWKSDKRITRYGYIKIRKLEHPFKDCDGFVLEHRLIAEKFLLNEENSIEIEGKKYLKPEFEVHHLNENKKDNRVENLVILSKSEHMKIHSSKRGCKKVNKYDLNNNYITTYNSIKEAGNENNIHAQNIQHCCKKQKGTAGGFIWKYK